MLEQMPGLTNLALNLDTLDQLGTLHLPSVRRVTLRSDGHSTKFPSVEATNLQYLCLRGFAWPTDRGQLPKWWPCAFAIASCNTSKRRLTTMR